MKRGFLFICAVMLAVSLPAQTAYRESLRVNENGEVVALDSSGNSNKAPVFEHGVGANRTNIGAAKTLWISARADSPPCVSSVCGSGTELDPIKVNTSAAFQTVLTAATDGSTIHVRPGTYPTLNLTISKSVKITGDRNAIFTPATGNNKPIFAVSGATTELILEGVSLVHGAVYREENNPAAIRITGASKRVRLINVFSSDFANTVYDDFYLDELIVENSDFVYTYGNAGISQITGDGHPCSPIVGHSKRLIVRNNTFDGLVDPTFAGVSGSPPAGRFFACDNFTQTGGHVFADISGNVVRNASIEGIRMSDPAPGGVAYSYSIRGNHITGVTYANQLGAYAPAIAIDRCQAVVDGNTITNTPMGVNVDFNSLDEDKNVVQITNNTMAHVLVGIHSSDSSSKSQFTGNTIWNASEPVRTVWGSLMKPQDLFGIRVNRGSVTRNTLISDEPVWDASPTLSSRASNVFTLSSVTGIIANTGAFYAYLDNVVAYFPVEGISGNNVTVNSGWAASYPTVTSGTLYYTKTVSPIKEAGGIVVENGGVDGIIYAEDNTIVGHRRDLAQLNSGRIVSRNTTSRNCHVVQADSVTISRTDIGDLLPRNNTFTGTNTFTGSNTFTANTNYYSGQPYYVQRFTDNDQPANQNIWDLAIDGGTFFGRTMNDNGTQRVQLFTFGESLIAFVPSIQTQGNIAAGSTGNITGYTISAEATVAGDGSLLTNLDARRVSGAVRDVADTDTTLTTDDYIVRYTTLTAARMVTLPSAASANGVFFIIKDRAGTATANPITFAAAVEGSTAGISTNYGVVRVQSDGTNWYRL